MIQTSPEYKIAVAKGTRNTTAHISFGIFDVTAKDDAEPVANTSQPFSDITTILDAVTQPGFNMATFEKDYFRLDGSFYLTPDNVDVEDNLGWWSQMMSDENGLFEPTTNLIPNPLMIDNLTGYAGNGTSIILSTEEGLFGGNAILCVPVNTGRYHGVYFTRHNIVAGNTYTLSFYAKKKSGGDIQMYANLKWRDINGTVITSHAGEQIILNDTWQRVSVTAICPESTYSVVSTLYAYNQTSPDETWYITGVQLEQKDHTTPFTVGSREYPTITIDFSEYHSSLGIGLLFDSIGGSYCTDFDVEWYHNEVLLALHSVVENTKHECFVDEAVENYNKVIIKFLKTDKPYRYVRFLDINFGLQEIFDSDTLISASVVEELDPSCSVLSVNTMKCTVLNEDQRFNMLNPEGIFAYLQRRQPLVVKSGLMLPSGVYEYVPLGTYYLSTWKNSTGLTATLEATDAIGLLDKTTYYSSEFWVNEPVSNVIEHILSDAGYFLWSISPELESEVINGYIPIKSHREALQSVLMTIRGSLRVDRNNVLTAVKPDYVTEQASVDYNTIIGTPTIEQKPLITGVSVTDFSYSLAAVVETLHESTFVLHGIQTVIIPFDKAPVDKSTVSATATGDGSVLEVIMCSATCVKLVIEGAGEMTLTVAGKPYEVTSKVVSASLPFLPAGEIPQIATVAENTLVCGNGGEVAQHVLDYYQHRIKQSMNFWYNPALQAGDNLSIQTMFGQNKAGIIERQEIDFAPALKGRIEVVG